MDSKLEIEQLSHEDERLEGKKQSSFDCGDKFLSSFVTKMLRKGIENDEFKCFAIFDGERLVSYITFTIHRHEIDKAINWGVGSSGSRRVPVISVEQLATDKEYKGRGLAKRLLAEVFDKVAVIANGGVIPMSGVSLLAHPDAVSFYEELGFKKIRSEQHGNLALELMFLHISQIFDSLAEEELENSA